MTTHVKIGFDPRGIVVPLSNLLPKKAISAQPPEKA